MEIPNNTGLLIRGPEPKDWVAGAETGIKYDNRMPNADWSEFLPDPEKQKGRLCETMACVSFSAANCIETQINWMIATKQILEADMTMLRVLGMIDKNNKFNCSDRFIAKMSGTTKQGNYMTAVWQAIHEYGLVAESDWPFDLKTFDWDVYYKEIPAGIINKAARIKEIFKFNYEFVFPGSTISPTIEIKDHLHQAPLQLAAPVCSPWNRAGVVTKCGLEAPGHATEIYAYDPAMTFINIFDTYDPYQKKLDWNYSMPYIIKGLVSLKKPLEETKEFCHKFVRKMVFGERSDEVKALQDALKIDGVFPPSVQSTGYYGLISRDALKLFMEKYNIGSPAERAAVDGMWTGPKTLLKLNGLFNKN
jgi:hypothetical protein